MGRPKSRDFKSFLKYLDDAPAPALFLRSLKVHIGGTVAMIAVPATISIPFILAGNWAAGILLPIISIPFVIGGWIFAAIQASKPRTESEAWQKRVSAARTEFESIRQDRKLHKNVDPIMMQLLEAGAYHWLRIKHLTESPLWTEASLPSHWASLRAQAQENAARAMEELLVMAADCTGKPERDRKKELEEVFDDLGDLDIIDALGGLKRIVEADWQRFAFQSDQARVLFDTARPIAEKLKTLADELEGMKPAVMIERSQAEDQLGLRPTSVDSIEMLLSELKATKAAEQELEQRQQH